MEEKVYLTKEGREKLKRELKNLVEVKKPSVAERIKEAREMGDILENPVYDTAIEDQGYIEGRIEEIEEILARSELIEKKKKTRSDDSVFVGSTVVVEVNGHKDTFTIVGVTEADPVGKLISNESPVGIALLGSKVGDTVEVKTPIFKTVYKILEIR